MLDAHVHVMQVKLCKANTRGVTELLGDEAQVESCFGPFGYSVSNSAR